MRLLLLGKTHRECHRLKGVAAEQTGGAAASGNLADLGVPLDCYPAAGLVLLSMDRSQEKSCNGAVCAQVAAKQMVGLYLSVWVRSEMLPYIRGVQVTSVGTGVMGYFGNKGAEHP